MVLLSVWGVGVAAVGIVDAVRIAGDMLAPSACRRGVSSAEERHAECLFSTPR